MAIFNSYVKLPEGTWLVSHCHVWCSVFVCDCCADLCKKDPGRRPFRGSYDGWMISYFWCFHQCPIPFVDWRLNVVLPGCFQWRLLYHQVFVEPLTASVPIFSGTMDLETDCSLKHFLNRLHPSSPHPDHLIIHAHGVAISLQSWAEAMFIRVIAPRLDRIPWCGIHPSALLGWYTPIVCRNNMDWVILICWGIMLGIHWLFHIIPNGYYNKNPKMVYNPAMGHLMGIIMGIWCKILIN